MKRLATFLMLLCSTQANALWRGKLDLPQNPEAIIARELHDGNWVAGGQEQIWHLEYTPPRCVDIGPGLTLIVRTTGCEAREIVHVSLAAVGRTDGTDVAIGPTAGINMGTAGEIIQNALKVSAPNLEDHAHWIAILGQWTSLEAGIGWRPVHGSDVHDLAWFVGAKVKVPVAQAYQWLKSGL